MQRGLLAARISTTFEITVVNRRAGMYTAMNNFKMSEQEIFRPPKCQNTRQITSRCLYEECSSIAEQFRSTGIVSWAITSRHPNDVLLYVSFIRDVNSLSAMTLRKQQDVYVL